MWEWQAPLGLICELEWATVLKVSTPPTGLGGGSASGKTTVARMIIEALDVPWVVLLSMDSFYKVRVPYGAGCLWEVLGRPPPHPLRGSEPVAAPPPAPSLPPPQVLTRQQQEQAAHKNFNFDHPDAFDFDLIISTLKKLKQGKSVKVPIYDFTTHSRKKDWVGRGLGYAGLMPGLWAALLPHTLFLCRKRCMVQMSSSSRVSWPLLTRHCWR